MKNFAALSLALAMGVMMLSSAPADAHRLSLKYNRAAYLQANRQNYLLHTHHRYARPLTDRHGNVHYTYIW